MDDNEALADGFPSCPNSGIGNAMGGRYMRNKSFKADHIELDLSLNIGFNEIQLYGIFSGFNGGNDVAKFAMNRMVHLVFLSEKPITKSLSRDEVMEALKRKFDLVANQYAQILDNDFAKRIFLKDTETASENELSEINQKIRQGTTALLVLRIDMDVYVLNCGTSMAIAITSDSSCPVLKLNEYLHDTDNPNEAQRLSDIGVKPMSVTRPTRAIGDFLRSLYYNENEEFADATAPPIISEADIYHYVIEDNWKSIVLISDGVVQNLKEFGVEDIPLEVYERLREDHTVTSTAQSLVDTFARRHLDAYNRNADEKSEGLSNKREEMTVIYIRLQQADPFEELNSASTHSTLDNSQPTIDLGPFAPYVDLDDPKPELVKKLEKYLLSEEPAISTKF